MHSHFVCIQICYPTHRPSKVMFTMGVSLLGVVSMHNRILQFTSAGGPAAIANFKSDSLLLVMADFKLLAALILAVAFIIISAIALQYD